MFLLPLSGPRFEAFAETPIYETRALWAPESAIDSAEEIDALIALMDRSNLNVLLPCVFCHGHVYFKNELMEMDPSGAEGFDPLAYMLEKANASGIEVHPWFCVTYVGTEGQEGGGPLMRAHPDFGARGPDGAEWAAPEGGIVFANVQNEAYRDFMAELMSGMARDYAVDGLHYDYIRAGAKAADPDTARRFAETFGHSMEKARPEDWIAWNGPAIDDIVKRTTEAAKRLRPDIFISAAVFAQTAFVAPQGQNAPKWLQNGWIDAPFTMNYEMNTTMMQMNQIAFDSSLGGKAAGVGLSLYQKDEGGAVSSRPADLVLDQIRAARKLKLHQFAFFASGYLDDAISEAMAKGPFRKKAIPVHRKID